MPAAIEKKTDVQMQMRSKKKTKSTFLHSIVVDLINRVRRERERAREFWMSRMCVCWLNEYAYMVLVSAWHRTIVQVWRSLHAHEYIAFLLLCYCNNYCDEFAANDERWETDRKRESAVVSRYIVNGCRYLISWASRISAHCYAAFWN